MDKEKIPVYVDPEMKQEIDIAVNYLGSKSRSDFCREAIAFYLGYLNHKKTVNYLSPLLLSAMKSELRSSVKFLGEMLFKLAVEQAVNSNLFAAEFEFDPDSVEGLRENCAKTVAKINGILKTEEAYKWQRSE